MKKKHHRFTAQHEDRREQGAVEESGDSGMNLPIRERRRGGEKGGEGAGQATPLAHSLSMMLETRDERTE